jgi:hypothetical protein
MILHAFILVLSLSQSVNAPVSGDDRRRVWVNLYGHTSPGDFAMANTDVLTGIDVDEGQNSSHGFGRNERAARRRPE